MVVQLQPHRHAQRHVPPVEIVTLPLPGKDDSFVQIIQATLAMHQEGSRKRTSFMETGEH